MKKKRRKKCHKNISLVVQLQKTIMSTKSFYELRPNKLGCLVFGIDLKQPISTACKEQIIKVENRRSP